ncbi:hypothetical protein CCM_08931 [Cordyceps militaris CM01]|uniref:Uncharacterized protein n=1 Tax=Cordyceps militaris (strain CM01) TaxID=983644 RepID=G3JSN9_CORMM|nr:uncharacterized protein CCM_08931 [Cordyceps militaris CM01]EGX88885.1 hypothetical protein CCM_08931 [Cordyceps militaris CM01]
MSFQQSHNGQAIFSNPFVVTEMYRVAIPRRNKPEPVLELNNIWPSTTLHASRKKPIDAFVFSLLARAGILNSPDQVVSLSDVARHPDKTAWGLVSYFQHYEHTHAKTTFPNTENADDGPEDTLLIVSPWDPDSAASWPLAALWIQTRLDAFLDNGHRIRVEMQAPDLFLDNLIVRPLAARCVGRPRLQRDWRTAIRAIIGQQESTALAELGLRMHYMAADCANLDVFTPTVCILIHDKNPDVAGWTLARERIKEYLAVTSPGMGLMIHGCGHCEHDELEPL